MEAQKSRTVCSAERGVKHFHKISFPQEIEPSPRANSSQTPKYLMDNKPTNFTVPTFKDEDEDDARREMYVTQLTEAARNELRRQDPFMYYSIFAPDGTVLRRTVQNAVVESLVAHVQGGGADDGHRPSGVIVQRRTSVATESDGFTQLVREFGLNNNRNGNNAQNNGEDAEGEKEDEEEADEGEGKREDEDEADEGGGTEDLDDFAWQPDDKMPNFQGAK
jgi:hypothetical protein